MNPRPDIGGGGHADWGARRFLAAGFVALAALLLGLGGWAAFARISGAVIAAGQVEVEGNRQVVQHPTGGVIAAIHVRDGDTVAAGDVLLRLEGDALLTERAIVEGQLFEILARKSRLAAERDGAEEIDFDPELVARAETSTDIAALIASQILQFDTRRKALAEESEQLGERRTQIGRQIEGLEAQRAATRFQIDLVGREIAAQETLYAQGLTQQVRLLTPQRERARLEGLEGQIDAAIAENRAKIAEIEIEILRLTTRLREEAIAALRDLEFREIELRERRTRLRADIDRLEIRSPVAGTVYGSTADTLRAVVRPAEPILHVVPSNAALIVRARIDAIHIDQVRVGQPAVLRFSAFDMRSTPEVDGEVLAVSADAFVDERTGSTYYRADLRVAAHVNDALGGKTLLPGMPVEAFIQTEQRSPMSYLAKPMATYFTRALRER